VNGLIETRSLATKAGDDVKRVLKSVDGLKVAKKGGGLAVTAFTGIPVFGLEEIFGSAVELIKDTVTDKKSREAVLKQLEGLKREKADEAAGHSVPTEIREFREAYKELIRKAGIKRLVVLTGCYFSVNGQMLQSDRGRTMVSSLPEDRLLTETDGSFTSEGGDPARPRDVGQTVRLLGTTRGLSPDESAALVLRNLKTLTR
jgi:hypothetical protein